jgi:peptide/nickel transport system substrate-binding protein
MRHTARLTALLLIALGCSADVRSSSSTADSARGGTIVIAVGGDPDGLFPPVHTTTTGKAVTEQIYDHLADLGSDLNTVGDAGFSPRLAKSWRWSPDSLSIAFTLDPQARWHDGAPVRASDVAFTYALYKDSATASPTAPLIANIDSVTAPDSLTAVFWFARRSPIEFYEATIPMVILPEHALKGVKGQALRNSDLARKPMGSGRFRFVQWTPGSSIEVVADTGNYHGRPRIDRLIWSIAPDPKTVFTRLIGGEADVLEQVPVGDLPQLAAHPELKTVLLPGLDYNFVTFNLRDPKNQARPHPLFGDRELRRALTMAVDRRRVVPVSYTL